MESACDSLEEDNNNNNGSSSNSSNSSSTGSSSSDTDQKGHNGDDQRMEEDEDEEEEDDDEEEEEGRDGEEEEMKDGVIDNEEMTIDDDDGGGGGGDGMGKVVNNPKVITQIVMMPTPTHRTLMADDEDDEDNNDEDNERSNFVIMKSSGPPQPTRTWSVEGPKLHIPQPPQRLIQPPKPQVQTHKPHLSQLRKQQQQQQLGGQHQKVNPKTYSQPIKDNIVNPSHTGIARGVRGAALMGPNEVPIKCGRGRGITLNMLMKDGVIEPGGGCLSLEYLGKKFSADLLPNGKIRWQENNEIFNSPSAWASHCKKLVNPSKKSGCGWASIKYKGRKLVSWKSMWCRKQRQNGNPSSKLVPPLDDSLDIMKSNRKLKDMFPKVPDYEIGHCPSLKPPLPAHINQCHKPVTNGKNKKRQHGDWSPSEFQEEALNLSLKGSHENTAKPRQSPQQQQQRHHHHQQQQHHHKSTPTPPPPPPPPPPPVPTPQQKLKPKQQQQHHQHSDPHSESIDPTHPRFPLVKHSNLLNRNADQDPNTLVQCETFESYGKFQPFTVSVTTNSMFLIDFHCHLTNSEVLGYLAGRWDQNTQHLNILQAFPCLSRLGDKENAPLIEAEIRHRMNKSGLSLVGWYHSHPHRPASPTIRDIDCQMTYQLKMKGIGSTYHPCLGFIIAPYDKTSKKKESTFQAFWVMPPPMEQPSDYGIPMEVQFSIYQNPSLTEELLTEMKNLVDFYKGSPDVVRFANIWHQSVTYLDKVKWSLLTKLPQDQDENSSTLEFVRSLLLSMRV